MKRVRGDLYQLALILLGVAACLFFGYFLYQEMFPEYKIYQHDYIAVEKFRSSYTHESPPDFSIGIKQLLLERKDKGNPVIDRCISCHVALEFPHFSPTKIEHDATGAVVYDDKGIPVKVINDEYVWAKINAKIHDLEDPKILEQLHQQGDYAEIAFKKQEAKTLKDLKIAHVGEAEYDVTKVLTMHPLMGKETRPFEFHPVEQYGCTSCHNGNGRGLTTETAHGPVFDGQYEKEFMGPEPEFTEIDPRNDPQFAHIFNGKPGHALLFQTTPLYVGALIQAKCVECHRPKDLSQETSKSRVEAEKSDIDPLITNYLAGQQLFISQACYACHRIAGFSRGGVGPELTNEGQSYPWFVKQSIVWPQADLASSTMPNYALDHEELEDLVTYLLGQNGGSHAVARTDYASAIQEWEAGKKAVWEKPISPVQVQDLRYAMTVFATEGCAACHRLKGFETNAGFVKDSTEKERIENRKWFEALFPEDIIGSALVKVLDAHQEEIDSHIRDDVRTGGLLDEIDNKYPGVIEAYYTPFKYAFRAKNDTLGTAEPKKLQQWKERVHRLMLLFAQEYGLGRLIGPRPNWSGIYRSDEWLLEHFKNPASHVPRSIMPVFPFDETKFYALTRMLDTLGMRNRNALRAQWKEEGFDPAMAYQIHCAQCHGEFLQGNGPVARWIYPIPKNLRNAEFLRNLTRDRVFESIMHGVKGTPMPPWGEVAADKPYLLDTPVLNSTEIESLVDWIYAQLPGENVIRNTEDVLKWNYGPKDVLEELKHEGSFATLKGQKDDNEALELFDVEPNPHSKTDSDRYYLKAKYDTPENIEQGRQFFELNCAVCHGKAGDGAGVRAGTMMEAKPRMLTNLDWIKTRDDLRLLRSIKYGVPGTAMTQWGDQTSGLQRIQLVLFIRSLTAEKLMRADLSEALYRVFDTQNLLIEDARENNYELLEKNRKDKGELQEKIQSFGKNQADWAKAFDQQASLSKSLSELNQKDERYVKLQGLLRKEKEQYQKVGLLLIQDKESELLKEWISVIELLANRFTIEDNVLKDTLTEEKEKALQAKQKAIVAAIHQRQQKLDSLSKLETAANAAITETELYLQEERQIIEELATKIIK